MAAPGESETPERPAFDSISENGMSSGSTWLPGPQDTIIEYALADGVRPAPGALFVRPNGEAWRLRRYITSWQHPDLAKTRPTWAVVTPGGAVALGDDLPADARLVWHP